MKSDYKWLDNWADKIAGRSVLELGAGSGIDTRYLKQLTDKLVACDLKPEDEETIRVDHSEPLPFENSCFDVVISSLSLHYFEWNKTLDIVQEFRRVLKTGGLLICRVNSVLDTNYGSVGFPEIEPRLYQVNGQLKRFFSSDDIHEMFSLNWEIRSLEEKQIDRYKNTKTVWEFGAVNHYV